MSDKNEAVAVVPRRQPEALAFRMVPASLGEAMEMAKLISGSELCPKAYRQKPQDCIVAYEYGAALGLSWLQSLRSVSVVNGQAALWGDAVPALIYGSRECERLHEIFEGEEGTDEFKAVCIMHRKGFPDEVRREFSVKDARTAGLWQKRGHNGGDTPWITYPKRMLQMRARGFAARDAFPDKLSGMILAEEAMDYPDAIEGTVVASEVVSDPLDRIPAAFREKVETAFTTLNLAPGLRIAKINEFMGADGVTPDAGATALIEWCKDEYAKRVNGQPRAAKSDNSKKGSTDGQGQPQAQNAGVQGKAADVVTAPAGDVRGGSAAIPTDAPQGSTQAGPLTAAEIPFAGTAGKVGF